MIIMKPSFEILTNLDGDQVVKNIERAARVCYKSEAKITLDSAEGFIRRIMKRGHHSVIEHESISLRIVCDRAMTHCLVRHRLAAYSQESTRYCNYRGGVAFIIPYWIDEISGVSYPYDTEKVSKRVIEFKDVEGVIWFDSMLESEKQYMKLLEGGWSAEKARSVLPNSLKADIVMTANIREWRHVLNLWCHKSSHRQAQEIMVPILQEFHRLMPVFFEDLWEKYKNDTRFLL